MSLNKIWYLIKDGTALAFTLSHSVSVHIMKFGNMLNYRHEALNIWFARLKISTPLVAGEQE